MKSIEVENDLYRYIASQTESIGEDASTILRRLLGLPSVGEITVDGPIKDPVDVQKEAVVLAKNNQPKIDDVKADNQVKVSADLAKVDDFNGLVMPKAIGEHKAAVARFLFLLEQLYHLSPEAFDNVLSISGRDRVYFAKDEATLLASNASTKPKQIGTTPFWVITNSNTGKKRAMLSKALEVTGCDSVLAKEISEQI